MKRFSRINQNRGSPEACGFLARDEAALSSARSGRSRRPPDNGPINCGALEAALCEDHEPEKSAAGIALARALLKLRFVNFILLNFPIYCFVTVEEQLVGNRAFFGFPQNPVL